MHLVKALELQVFSALRRHLPEARGTFSLVSSTTVPARLDLARGMSVRWPDRAPVRPAWAQKYAKLPKRRHVYMPAYYCCLKLDKKNHLAKWQNWAPAGSPWPRAQHGGPPRATEEGLLALVN